MKKSLGLLASTTCVALLAACGSSAESGPSTVHVVASFYPLQYVAEQVGGSFVEVRNLTSPGVEPHDVELTPKQVGDVQDGDLVVYQKHFQAAVDDAVDQAGRSSRNTLDLASVLTLKSVQTGAEEGHDDEDPHTWLDPANMVTVTEAMEKKLAAIDPDHATTYATNAEKLVAELTSLDADFAAGLKSCRTRTIVTSHAAFQYLAARYDLTQVPIAGIDPASEPSPSQLADITKLVRSQQITTIFTEELVSPAIARTIARETGTSVDTLDPIEGLSDDTRGETYVTLMKNNLKTLQKANSCE